MLSGSNEHFTPGSMGHTMPQPPKPSIAWGSTIAFILLIIMLGLGGLYFWGKYVDESQTVYYNQN